ncbi:MAG: hypothetical protein BM564_07175 [Bacteroidetes bacterium MedPE-SWsnd-G2]|nr:MAG: hypothetical protein BM564_07175 [Bacteroidetes bacterium MedPE-SWsnd-G2]
MVRNTLIFLLVCSSFLGCKIKEKPNFIRVDHIEVVEANSKQVILKADALFENLNHVGGTLQGDSIKVNINAIEVAHINSTPFKVPALDTFNVPFSVKIPTEKIYKNNNSLQTLIRGVFSKKFDVNFKGNILYSNFGFTYTYPLDETETVKIKF